MTPSTAKRHLLKLQSDIEKSEAKLQEAGFSDANGSVRKFDLRTIEAINVLVVLCSKVRHFSQSSSSSFIKVRRTLMKSACCDRSGQV